MKIALLQFDIFWEQVRSNLDVISRYCEQLEQDTELLVLPEMFSTGFSMRAHDLGESMEGKTVHWMQQLASKYQLVIAGSLIIREKGFAYNRFVWVEPCQKVRYYDKKYLFTPAGEHLYYQKGKEHKVFTFRNWRICPQICYELRFPEWQRAALPFDLLIFVASWPSSRIEAWRHLLVSRAIENQCYVVGVNRVGVDANQLQYNGQSLIVGPKGDLILDAGSTPGLHYGTIDIEELKATRERMPFLIDRDPITFD